jgi:hypothetical protein
MKYLVPDSIRPNKHLAWTALSFAVQLSASVVLIPGTTVRATPYDRYMAPVRRTFNSMHRGGATMERVNTLMRQGRTFRYRRSDPYSPASPEETAARRAGDCKDKALWLMSQLQDPNVHFVIGKLDRRAPISHAWLEWEHDGQRWILDCAMHSHAIPADHFGPDEYVPLYSYSKETASRD